jgi:hypothetical protein
MNLEQTEAQITIVSNYIAELNECCKVEGDIPVAELQTKISAIKRVFRFADSRYQVRYLDNFNKAIEELATVEKIFYRNIILQSLVDDLEQHRLYLVKQKENMAMRSKKVFISQAMEIPEEKAHLGQLSHLLGLLRGTTPEPYPSKPPRKKRKK